MHVVTTVLGTTEEFHSKKRQTKPFHLSCKRRSRTISQDPIPGLRHITTLLHLVTSFSPSAIRGARSLMVNPLIEIHWGNRTRASAWKYKMNLRNGNTLDSQTSLTAKGFIRRCFFSALPAIPFPSRNTDTNQAEFFQQDTPEIPQATH